MKEKFDEVRERVNAVREHISGWRIVARVVLWGAVGLFLLLIVAVATRVGWYTWVDNYQFGYVYDYWSGAQYPVNHNGYVYSPFYQKGVHTIDLRPMQVQISKFQQRVLNAKLIHFDPYRRDPKTGQYYKNQKGQYPWEEFLAMHGRKDYEGPPTSNDTSKADNLFADILANYAFDETGTFYPFMVIDKVLGPNGEDNKVATTPGGRK